MWRVSHLDRKPNVLEQYVVHSIYQPLLGWPFTLNMCTVFCILLTTMSHHISLYIFVSLCMSHHISHSRNSRWPFLDKTSAQVIPISCLVDEVLAQPESGCCLKSPWVVLWMRSWLSLSQVVVWMQCWLTFDECCVVCRTLMALGVALTILNSMCCLSVCLSVTSCCLLSMLGFGWWC